MVLNRPLAALQNPKIVLRVGEGDGQLGAAVKELLEDRDDETVPVRAREDGTMRSPTVQVLNRDAIQSRVESLAKDASLNFLCDLSGRG